MLGQPAYFGTTLRISRYGRRDLATLLRGGLLATAAGALLAVTIGFGRIVALHDRSSTLHQIY